MQTEKVVLLDLRSNGGRYGYAMFYNGYPALFCTLGVRRMYLLSHRLWKYAIGFRRAAYREFEDLRVFQAVETAKDHTKQLIADDARNVYFYYKMDSEHEIEKAIYDFIRGE